MPRARLSRLQYEKLVEAFREKPGNVNYAHKQAKVHMRTAKKAWEYGWERPTWARAIKGVFEQEEIGVRSKMRDIDVKLDEAERAARLRDEKEKARLVAVDERLREAQGVKASISTSLMLLGNLGQFQKASIEMCRHASASLLAEVQAGTLEWREALKILDKLALTAKRITEQFQITMELLRKHVGEPEKIVGFIGEMPTTDVDGAMAINALGGEDKLRQAIMDVAQGVDSPEAEALIEFQVESSGKQMH
jgi:hypothetical protein